MTLSLNNDISRFEVVAAAGGGAVVIAGIVVIAILSFTFSCCRLFFAAASSLCLYFSIFIIEKREARSIIANCGLLDYSVQKKLYALVTLFLTALAAAVAFFRSFSFGLVAVI